MSEIRDKTSCSMLSSLNPEQLKAATCDAGHVLVLAGPGTGKTRVLVARAAWLLENTVSKSISAITFTNQAANEMSLRIKAIGLNTERLSVSTFHQLALKALVEDPAYSRDLIDEQDARRLCLKAARSVGLSARECRSVCSKMLKSRDADEPDLCLVRQEYLRMLDSYGFVDFDSLLSRFLTFLRSLTGMSFCAGISHLLVDEFQDVSPIQYDIVLEMARHGVKVFAIGDPDQAIYGFRGADPKLVYKLTEDLQGVVQISLQDAYRSGQNILDAAANVVRRRPLLSKARHGGEIFLISFPSPNTEANWIVRKIEEITGGLSMDAMECIGHTSDISLSDIAVLYRVNQMAIPLEKALLHSGIPFIRSDKKSPLSDPEIRWIYTLWQAVRSNRPEFFLEQLPGKTSEWIDKFQDIKSGIDRLRGREAILAIIKLLGLDINRPVLSVLLSMAHQFDGPHDMSISMRNPQDILGISFEGIRLLSLHAAKGLEFSHVFIVGCEDGLLPLADSDMDEERRLLYVGLTRAKDQVFLTTSSKRPTWISKGHSGRKSPFLDLIPSKLVTELSCAKKGRCRKKASRSGGVQHSLF